MIGPRADFQKLERVLYAVRRKYYGDEHARDLRRELCGSSLFSNVSFRHQKEGFSRNLTVAREILSWVQQESTIRVIGVTAHGDRRPPLLAPAPKLLARPFRELCVRMIAQIPTGASGEIVFDQRIGAQEGISIAVCHYLAGIPGLRRMVPHPLVGVSNVWPGLQLADIVAHVLGRYATGDRRFDSWYHMVSRLQMEGEDHHGQHLFGLIRLEWAGEDSFALRKIRTKK